MQAMSDPELKIYWRVFNAIIFKNALDDAIAVVYETPQECRACAQYDGDAEILGYYLHEENKIGLNKHALTDPIEMVKVLVHEMVHQWQREKACGDYAHGYHYQRWRRIIQRRHHLDI
jgi:hypothetical protein